MILGHVIPGLALAWYLPVYTGRMYALTPVYAVSRVLNCMTGGRCSWTFSARVGEAVVLGRAPVRGGREAERVINIVFRAPDHCLQSAIHFGAKIDDPELDNHEYVSAYSYAARTRK